MFDDDVKYAFYQQWDHIREKCHSTRWNNVKKSHIVKMKDSVTTQNFILHRNFERLTTSHRTELECGEMREMSFNKLSFKRDSKLQRTGNEGEA